MNEAMPGIGTVLDGRYRIERVLGRGGMGSVFAARHLQIDEPVALKLLHGSLARDPDLVTRFQREAKAARKIQSEHAVKILDVGLLANGAPYLVMEQLTGMDLEQLTQQGPLPVLVAVDYVLQAMVALAEAHMQGVVHRDLKPANLFVTRRPDGTSLVKVLDFGISKVAHGEGELGLTKTGAAPLGSPLYMAPEQMRSSRAVDSRVDIWALGAILYELLAGSPPFTGTTMTEVCAAVLQDPVPSLHALRVEIPVGIDAIVGKCLAKEPSGRYQDVAALAVDLATFAPNRGPVDRITGIFRESSATAPTAMAPPIVLTPRPRQGPLASFPPPPVMLPVGAPNVTEIAAPMPAPAQPRRRRASSIAIGLTLVLLGALGIGTAWFIRRTRAERASAAAERADAGHAAPAPLETLLTLDTFPGLKTAPVAFRPMPGSYAGPIDVAMMTRSAGAWIHYSTTGDDPTETSPTYTTPVHLQAGGILKARAFGPARAPSDETVAVYPPPVRAENFHLLTPVVVDLGTAACGGTTAPIEIPIKNAGPAAAFTASLRKGTASPFVLGDAEAGLLRVEAGETKIITVKAKPIAIEPASLTDVTDILEITVGALPPRSISLHAKALGAMLEVSGVHDVDIGDTPVGQKRERFLYFQNTGNTMLDLAVSVSDAAIFGASTTRLKLEPDHFLAVGIAFTPKVPGQADGKLIFSVSPGSAYCDEPPAPIPLRGVGTN